MPLGRAGRTGFVVGGVVAVGIAVVAGLAQPWSSPSASAGVGIRAAGGGGSTEVVETGLALGGYSIAGVAEWRGDLVAITGAGAVARSPDARRWEEVPATGFAPPERDGRDGEECAGDAVRGLAARNGLLVAVGQRAVPPEPGDDYCDARLKLWRSSDATTWEAAEPSGLAETDHVDAVVSDAAGFLAFGSSRVADRDKDESRGRGLTVWRSSDGVTWEVLPTEGLSKPGEYKYQAVNSVAVRGERMLAAIGTECVDCYDDHVVALWRSDGVGAWQELKFSGLDALDQANSDIVPAVAATTQGYLAFASVGEEHSEDRTPALWSSTDGQEWEASELEGPSPSGGSMDAAITTSRGAVALDNTRVGLVVWRVEPR
jgi:hypothetical protein